MKRTLATLLVGAATLTGFALVSAQDQPLEAPQTRVYVIKPGDTLWDISASLLNSPWYWPRIWHLNPYIANPHLIYPDRELVLPGFGGEPATAPVMVGEAPAPETAPAEAPVVAEAPPPEVEETEEVAEEPAPDVTGEDAEILAVEQGLPELPTQSRLETAVIRVEQEKRFYVRVGSEGFISAEKIKAAGTVVGAHTPKLLYTQHDKVFISLGEGSGVEVGQRFTAYLPAAEVQHPVTGRFVGYRTKQLGVLQVLQVHEDVSTALIVEAYDAVDKGALLIPFEPYQKTIYPQPSPEQLDGVVLIGAEGLRLFGEHSIVYVDRGTDHDLNIGQVFQFFRPMERELDKLTNRKLAIPAKVLGAGIVVDAQTKTASVLVWDSVDYIEPGDRFRPLVR